MQGGFEVLGGVPEPDSMSVSEDMVEKAVDDCLEPAKPADYGRGDGDGVGCRLLEAGE